MSGTYDAVITGSGPNGLAAAIYLQKKGLKTVVFERSTATGGCARTMELTLPGFRHDIGSSIHPLAYDSPFFKTLPLKDFGLKWIHPPVPFAHPFDDGDAYACYREVEETASQLGTDSERYQELFARLSENWHYISQDILGPLRFPAFPLKTAHFGLNALKSAKHFVNSRYKEEKSRVFFYGSAAHSTLPLSSTATASFGLVLNTIAHTSGWPFPEGGAGKISEALSAYYKSLGGEVVINYPVKNVSLLPVAKAYLFDLTPKQLLEIEATRFTKGFRRKLGSYKYGAGVFKLDYALSGPIPYINKKCREAGTVHIGYSTKEIENHEKNIHRNSVSCKPYVIVCQHSVFDPTRAPEGKHTMWAYCHVPNGDISDMTEVVEKQIEKAAPGFRDCIIRRRVQNTRELEEFNPNLVGGDINGGKQDITQMFTRPVLSLKPYSTPDPRIYICSSSTPPGGGVHGMCGFFAARQAYKDHFL